MKNLILTLLALTTLTLNLLVTTSAFGGFNDVYETALKYDKKTKTISFYEGMECKSTSDRFLVDNTKRYIKAFILKNLKEKTKGKKLVAGVEKNAFETFVMYESGTKGSILIGTETLQGCINLTDHYYERLIKNGYKFKETAPKG